MNRLVLLSSRHDRFDGHICRLAEEAVAPLRILLLEELSRGGWEIEASDTVYVASPNLALAASCLGTLPPCRLINRAFLGAAPSKQRVQELLEAGGLPVPRRYRELPPGARVYVKENRHEGAVLTVSSAEEYRVWQNCHPNTEHYLEEALLPSYEVKGYFVFGKLFLSTKEVPRTHHEEYAARISELLGLEVFSFDLMAKGDGTEVILDVNFSPGFYRCDEARRAFLAAI